MTPLFMSLLLWAGMYASEPAPSGDGKQVCMERVCWDYEDGSRICGDRVYIAVKCKEGDTPR